MNKKFEEPKFEKTEFEAVAYLSNESSQVVSDNFTLRHRGTCINDSYLGGKKPGASEKPGFGKWPGSCW